MDKVTGIGGIFFKSDDPEKTKQWYRTHLGMPTDQYGVLFGFHPRGQPDRVGYLQWSVMKSDTDYFAPAEQEFMINYRVADLPALLDELRAAGVTVVGEMQTFDYGKFAHILDPEGRKIELWEPVDEVFTEYEKDNPQNG